MDTTDDGSVGRVDRVDHGARTTPLAVEDTLVLELEIELVKDGLVLGVDGGRVVEDGHGTDGLGTGGGRVQQRGSVEREAVQEHRRHYVYVNVQKGKRNEGWGMEMNEKVTIDRSSDERASEVGGEGGEEWGG